jgi:hypothetical protein
MGVMIRPALGPTQPPIQWVPGAVYPGIKHGRGMMLTTHPLLLPRLRKSRSSNSSHPIAPLWSVTGPLYLFSGRDDMSYFSIEEISDSQTKDSHKFS